MKDDARIISSTRIVSGLTLVSRVLGLVRDTVCSYYFGAGLVYGAFSIAFQIPNLFRRLFGEGALAATTIPVFSTVMEKDGRQRATAFASRLLTLLVIVLVGVAVLMELALVGLRFALPQTERTSLILLLTAVMTPYLVLVCTIGVMAGLLNVLHAFALPTLAPIVLNIFMIAAAVAGPLLWPTNDHAAILLLACAVLVAGTVQFAGQVGGLRRRSLAVAPQTIRASAADSDVRRVLRAMAPLTFGLAAVQINTLADTIIAATCVPNAGAPAVLFYAQRLYQFPLGVFAIAYAVVLFPTLSARAARDEMDDFRASLAAGIRMVMFIGLPCSAGLMLIARPVIALLFQHGEFTAADTVRVSSTLVAYGAGVWAYGLLHILVRAFYALHDYRSPTISSAAVVALNLALNLTLVWRMATAGLGLATAICAAIQCVWLTALLSRRVGGLDWPGIGRSVAKSLLATLVMAAAVWLVLRFLPTLEVPRLNALLRTLAACATGAGAFAIASLLSRSPEAGRLLRRYHVRD